MQYFRDRNIEESRQVLKASSGIANEVLRDWYLNDYDRFDSMLWVDFVEEVRARFLPAGWSSAIHAQIMNKRQGQDQSFDDFVLEIERLNARLRNTKYRFSDDRLRDVLGANIVEDLRLTVDDQEISSIVGYVAWKNALSNADKRRFRLRAMMNQVVASRNATAKTKAPNTSTSTTVRSSTTTVRLPPLTVEERQLLNAHRGCYKCRRFYQNHTSGTCPNGYPDASKYTTLTVTQANAAKTTKDTTVTRTVAAVVEDGQELVDNTTVAAVWSSPVAASMSGILGTGTDSEECVSPFFAQHTLLHASLLSPSPGYDPDVFPMLIDSGSPTVLIRRDVVDQAGLRLRPLPTPYRLGNAWGSEQRESHHWVKLRVSLSDRSWDSISCRAIVVSSLCSPVILGKPFLELNSIIEDHSTRQLIHKLTGRDLLVPLPPPRVLDRPLAPSRLELEGNADDVRRIAHRRFLRDVEKSTLRRQVALDNEDSDESQIWKICAISAVRDRVESLAMQIELDAENVAHRQYDCPKKY